MSFKITYETHVNYGYQIVLLITPFKSKIKFMKKIILIIAGVLLLNSCLKNNKKANEEQGTFSYKSQDENKEKSLDKFDSKDDSYTRVSSLFNHIDSVLKIDNGKFWNHQIYGPLLIVDNASRTFIANENNKSSTFIKNGNVYHDTLPKGVIIANTAFNWDDKRWSMVMSPLPPDDYAMTNLIIHELFHRMQPEIGFDNLMESSNNHLNLYQGRLLLTLELEALKKAPSDGNILERSNLFSNLRCSINNSDSL